MFYSKVRFPIFFQGVDTYFTIFGNVGMEDFCEEERLWRTLRKVFAQSKFYSEETIRIRRTS